MDLFEHVIARLFQFPFGSGHAISAFIRIHNHGGDRKIKARWYFVSMLPFFWCFRKANELVRLFEVKASSGLSKLGLTSSCKIVICIELAANSLNIPISKVRGRLLETFSFKKEKSIYSGSNTFSGKCIEAGWFEEVHLCKQLPNSGTNSRFTNGFHHRRHMREARLHVCYQNSSSNY